MRRRSATRIGHSCSVTVEVDLPLVDHHVHGVITTETSWEQWASMLSEGRRPNLDSQLGLAIRRWCAPLLDLPAFASSHEYFARRQELGVEEVNRRLLRASGVDTFLLDTGYMSDLAAMRKVTGQRVEEVVRIETVMEAVTDEDFPDAFRQALREASANAVGLKSVVAYRHGFDFDPARPSDAEVSRAWQDHAQHHRVTDPVLLWFGLWCAIDLGLPLQLHAGFGDTDLDLHRCDPLLLTPWLREVEPTAVPVVLLHCYPFHRNAGYLAHVFPNVYLDTGLAINHTGLRSDAVIAESLELAPFDKVLFSTDGCGPVELHYLGARLWRRGMSRVLTEWVDAGECSAADGQRIASMVGRENAVRVYDL